MISFEKELVEYRTPTSKLFQVSEREYCVQSKIKQIHFQDENGNYVEIEETPQRNPDGEIVCSQLPYHFKMNKKGIGFSCRSRKEGFISVTLAKIKDRDFDNESEYNFIIERGKVIVPNLEKDLDLIINIKPAGVKVWKVLKTERSPRKFTWRVEHDKKGAEYLTTEDIFGFDNLEGSEQIRRMCQMEVTKENVTDTSYLLNEVWTGFVKNVDPVTHIMSWSNDPVYPVLLDPTTTFSISATADDCYSRLGGSVLISTNVRMGDSNLSGTYNAGLRFQNVSIPQGSTISSATLTVNVVGSSGIGGAGSLQGAAVDNAPAWATGANSPASITKSTASTAVAALVTTGSKSYDVKSIIQEIVNRAGWVSNNSLSICGVGSSTGNVNNWTEWEDYAAVGTAQASLQVTYTPPASAPTPFVMGTSLGDSIMSLDLPIFVS